MLWMQQCSSEPLEKHPLQLQLVIPSTAWKGPYQRKVVVVGGCAGALALRAEALWSQH